MTPDKQRQKLGGQSSIAQKVFQYVPINELWSPLQIASALQRETRSRIDMHVLRGCLGVLADAGLVRATSSGTYRRATVSAEITTEKKEPELTTPTATPTKPAAPVSAIDLLAGIAKSMRALAGDIEAAALAIEEGQAKNTEEVQKLRQLQALLKGLS